MLTKKGVDGMGNSNHAGGVLSVIQRPPATPQMETSGSQKSQKNSQTERPGSYMIM